MTEPPTHPRAATGGPISHAIFRVARLHRAAAGRLLRETGLYPGQELVMMHLWDSGPQRQVDLVHLIDADAATMARMVRRLEQAGFVRRRPCPGDRRAAFVEATAASLALRDQVERVWNELEELTTRKLSDEEFVETLAMLGRLEAGLSEPSGVRAEG
jgi:MarR family transcriptional regulator, organic hydroperoxide resistance regulator